MIIITLSFHQIAFSNIILVCIILEQFEQTTEFFIVCFNVLTGNRINECTHGYPPKQFTLLIPSHTQVWPMGCNQIMSCGHFQKPSLKMKGTCLFLFVSSSFPPYGMQRMCWNWISPLGLGGSPKNGVCTGLSNTVEVA